MELPVSKCVACNGFLPVGEGMGEYVKCPVCATLQLWPLPETESNAAFETDDVALQMEETDNLRNNYFERRLNLLMSPSTGRSRLLDIGCSTGRLMKRAAARGWQTTGIEMSVSLARRAREDNPGTSVHEGDILRMDLSGLVNFDAVTALDVIEHVLNPDAFLQRIHMMLAPGGQVLLQTPNARSLRARLQGSQWNMRIPEYHFHLFSPKGMILLLNRLGFTVKKVTTVSGRGTESGFAAKVTQTKETLLAGALLGNALLLIAEKQ